jgi:hypothetical protein
MVARTPSGSADVYGPGPSAGARPTPPRDPYAALFFREFQYFLVLRFALVFDWSMQFVVIEWEIYSLTKDPLSLGIIGIAEIIPALSLAVFLSGIADGTSVVIRQDDPAASDT